MTRSCLALLLFAALARAAQSPAATPKPAPPPSVGATSQDDDKYEKPPEEDESLVPKQYSFNPILARRDMNVGTFYFKKGKYKAAADRFEEATKWNPGLAEAYLRLGETEEKLGDLPAMRKALTKYLELEPNGKEAAAIRRKLGETSGNKS